MSDKPKTKIDLLIDQYLMDIHNMDMANEEFADFCTNEDFDTLLYDDEFYQTYTENAYYNRMVDFAISALSTILSYKITCVSSLVLAHFLSSTNLGSPSFVNSEITQIGIGILVDYGISSMIDSLQESKKKEMIKEIFDIIRSIKKSMVFTYEQLNIYFNKVKYCRDKLANEEFKEYISYNINNTANIIQELNKVEVVLAPYLVPDHFSKK